MNRPEMEGVVVGLPTVYTAQQVADRLEVNVETVRLMAREGEIASFKVRGARRFTEDAVQEVIDRKARD